MLKSSIQHGISNPLQTAQMQGLPLPTAAMKNTSDQKTKEVLREQSMAVSSDICAEYGAVSRLNDIFVSLVKAAKEETNPEQKQILEARLNTINQMILQREMKINRLEMIRTRIDAQLKI